MADSFCQEYLARPSLVSATRSHTGLSIFPTACSGAVHVSRWAPAAAGKQSPLATDHIAFHYMSTNKTTSTSDEMTAVTRRALIARQGNRAGLAVSRLQWWGELSRGLSCSGGAQHPAAKAARTRRQPPRSRLGAADREVPYNTARRRRRTQPGFLCSGTVGAGCSGCFHTVLV